MNERVNETHKACNNEIETPNTTNRPPAIDMINRIRLIIFLSGIGYWPLAEVEGIQCGQTLIFDTLI